MRDEQWRHLLSYVTNRISGVLTERRRMGHVSSERQKYMWVYLYLQTQEPHVRGNAKGGDDSDAQERRGDQCWILDLLTCRSPPVWASPRIPSSCRQASPHPLARNPVGMRTWNAREQLGVAVTFQNNASRNGRAICRGALRSANHPPVIMAPPGLPMLSTALKYH